MFFLLFLHWTLSHKYVCSALALVLSTLVLNILRKKTVFQHYSIHCIMVITIHIGKILYAYTYGNFSIIHAVDKKEQNFVSDICQPVERMWRYSTVGHEHFIRKSDWYLVTNYQITSSPLRHTDTTDITYEIFFHLCWEHSKG